MQINQSRSSNSQSEQAQDVWSKNEFLWRFIEIIIVSFTGLYLAYQANQLSTIANNISQESNDIARMDYGVDINSIETKEGTSKIIWQGSGGPRVEQSGFDIIMDVKQLNGIKKLKILGANGNVLDRSGEPLVFFRDDLKLGKNELYLVEKRPERTVKKVHLSTGQELADIGYYEYFYILEEYNQDFQLYLVAKKSDKDGNVLNDFQVFSKYDIHDLKYSTDKIYAELDKKMAENYERIYNQYKTLGQTEE